MWLGTYADLALRFCAVVEARERLGAPVHGVVVGVPGEDDDDSSAAWHRGFAGAWRSLGLDRPPCQRDALTYAIAEEPKHDWTGDGMLDGGRLEQPAARRKALVRAGI